MMIAEIFAGVLVVVAGLIMVVTMVGLWRAPDAQTQANMLGPTTGVAIPLLIFAKMAYDISRHGFVFSDVARALIAVVAYLVVLALGAFLLAGRSWPWRLRRTRRSRRTSRRRVSCKISWHGLF